MNLTAPQKNALHGLDMLLNLSNVRVTRTTLREKLWQHPDFPSLISLSDTLDELKVDNIAARLTTDELPEIPLPALAYLNSEGGLFVPVRAIAAGAVEWWHNQRGWQTESLTEFNQKWDGITLLIEPTEQSGEADYVNSRKRQAIKRLRLPFVVIGLLVCLGVWTGAYHTPLAAALPYYALVLVYTAGLAVSGLLVWYSLDADNPFLRSICQLSSRTTCSAVLNTPAAKLLSWLSWAEVGLFYFGGGLLALLFFRTNTATLYPLLLGLSIAALPYTFWSVYYQWHRARQWCVLCLAVQVLLWVGFGLLLYFHPRPFWPAGFGGPEIALLISSFLPIPILWTLLKPIWNRALHTDSLQRSIQIIKFDEGYIESLRQKVRAVPPIFTEMRVPTIGDAEAVDTLTIVTNPTCLLCARIHTEIEVLMRELQEEGVRCQFIIAVDYTPSSVSLAVARRVLSQPHEKMIPLLHQWYKKRHLESWLKETANKTNDCDGMRQVEFHQRWCELANINTAPAILFNGVELPGYYTIQEFKKLINCLRVKREVVM